MTHLIQLTKTNADHFFDFWLATYQHKLVNAFFFKPYYYSKEKMRAMYDAYINNPNVHFFIYVDAENKPIGTCRVTHFTGVRDHAVMMNAVAIHPDIHGSGHGQAMMTLAKEFIIHRYPNVTRIELTYEGDNAVARHFYEKKLGYVQQAVIYSDWWIRQGNAEHDDELLKTYPWYCDERFCVHSITAEKGTPSKFDVSMTQRLPKTPAALPQSYLIEAQSPANLEKISSSYSQSEQNTLQQIIKEPHQTIFTLKQNNETVAFVVVRPYYGDIRLRNSVVLPCIAYADGVDESVMSSFLLEAMAQYQKQNPRVLHFACCEQDTAETWYTEQHSKIQALSRILHNADLQFVGELINYFSPNSTSGRNLIFFERVTLDLTSAKKCIAVSRLFEYEKGRLNGLVTQIQGVSNLSSREQYEIYRMIRFVAYPQDYSKLERKDQLAKSFTLLKTSAHFDRIASLTEQLHSMLQKMVDSSFSVGFMREPKSEDATSSFQPPTEKNNSLYFT